MTDIPDRIKLAEAMGWSNYLTKSKAEIWEHSEHSTRLECPDPFTDANDCEALIRHINSLGWSVVIDWQHDDPKHAPGVWIEFYHFETEVHERIEGMDRDRWKQGVCKLALKVLASEADKGSE